MFSFMSIILSRRDAIRGAMAATAALAAAPYLGNIVGGAAASPVTGAPAGATAAPASLGLSAPSGAETTVLLIKGDTIKSYGGLQTIAVQDAALASKLRSVIQARLE